MTDEDCGACPQVRLAKLLRRDFDVSTEAVKREVQIVAESLMRLDRN
jgi:hypothetical protein